MNKLLLTILMFIMVVVTLVNVSAVGWVTDLSQVGGTGSATYINSTFNVTNQYYMINQTNNFTVIGANITIVNNYTMGIKDTLNDSFGFVDGTNVTLNITAFDHRYMSGGVKSFFFTNHTSDVIGMYNTTIYLSDLHEDSITITKNVGDGENIVADFLSIPETEYAVAGGTRTFRINAKVSATTKITQLRGYIYITNLTGGQLILLRNSSLSAPLTTSEQSYTMTSPGEFIVINNTSRILFRIVAQKESGGAAEDVTLYLEDNSYSRLDVPSPVGVTDITGLLPYNGATKNVDMGVYNITAKWFFGLLDFKIDTLSASWLQFNGSTLSFNFSNLIFVQGTMGNTRGAIINSIDNHTGNSNNIIFAVLGNGSTNVMMPHFWIQNGAGSQASGVSRSFMIVNENPTQQNTTNITSCIEYAKYANFTLNIDCNTTTTGADLLVGDDMQVVGDAFMNNTNITGLMTTQNIRVNGNVSIKRPFGSWSSTETQIMGAINKVYPITFNYTDEAYQIIKQGNTNFSVEQTGEYFVSISALFDTDSPNVHVELWIQYYNFTSGIWSNVPRSNTKMQIPTASTESVLVVSLIMPATPQDKFRIVMATDNAGSQLLYETNSSYSPEVPSIIMVAHKISEIANGY